MTNHREYHKKQIRSTELIILLQDCPRTQRGKLHIVVGMKQYVCPYDAGSQRMTTAIMEKWIHPFDK